MSTEEAYAVAAKAYVAARTMASATADYAGRDWLRAIVDAVWPLAVAEGVTEGRRQAAEAIRARAKAMRRKGMTAQPVTFELAARLAEGTVIDQPAEGAAGNESDAAARRSFVFPLIPLDVVTVRDNLGAEWFRLSEDSDGRGARWSRSDYEGCYVEPQLVHERGPLVEVPEVVYRWRRDESGAATGLDRLVSS